MEELAEIGEDLVTYLNFYIYQVEHATDPEQQATGAVAVSSYYEAVGICELLLDADVDAFFHHLIRSGQTRKWLLQQSADSIPPKALKVSNVKPLLAAIAADQFDLAREIAKLSARKWFSGVEYEDDFCYAHFIHRYLIGDPKEDLSAILDRFKQVLEDTTSSRLALCQVLLEEKRSDFEKAFLQLVNDREDKIEKIKRESAYWDGRDALLYPNTVVFLEGLAWLRLFKHVGVVLDDEYRYCPRLARKDEYSAFVVTTFPYLTL